MRESLTVHIIALTAGLILDWVIGDPHALPHPIRLIGRLISALEKRLYPVRDENAPEDPSGEFKRGCLLWIIVNFVTVLLTTAVLFAAGRLHLIVRLIAETILTCYLLAAGSLCRESMAVLRALKRDGITKAREALSMIVGRDTGCLSEEEIIKAAVETVAENASDGVIAPLFYTAIGGPVLGLLYKAVNTMDSMLGYRNERYRFFGRTAAVMDDVFNFLPSRIAAVLMVLAAHLSGWVNRVYDGREAFRIWRRDRHNHLSPNAGQTESVCAGALGIQLGGTHLYQGVPVEKPTIGDPKRNAEGRDITRANVLMALTEILCALIILGNLLWIRFLLTGQG